MEAADDPDEAISRTLTLPADRNLAGFPSWTTCLSFGHHREFVFTLLVPFIATALFGYLLQGAGGGSFSLPVSTLSWILSGLAVLLLVGLLATVWFVGGQTFSPAFHETMTVVRSWIAYLVLSGVLSLVGAVLIAVLFRGGFPTLTPVNFGLFATLVPLNAILLATTHYQRTVSGVYSGRSTVEERIGEFMDAVAEVNRRFRPDASPGDATERISDALEQLTTALGDCTLADERQLRDDMRNLHTLLEKYHSSQETIVTGKELNGGTPNRVIRESHGAFRSVYTRLTKISNDHG